MDYHNYQALNPEEKVQVWKQLEETHGWQILKERLLKKMVETPDVKGVDGKEAFYFEKVKQQGVLEIFNYPNEQIKVLRTSRPKA